MLDNCKCDKKSCTVFERYVLHLKLHVHPVVLLLVLPSNLQYEKKYAKSCKSVWNTMAPVETPRNYVHFNFQPKSSQNFPVVHSQAKIEISHLTIMWHSMSCLSCLSCLCLLSRVSSFLLTAGYPSSAPLWKFRVTPWYLEQIRVLAIHLGI